MIDWETGKVYPPFAQRPTPTPTLIDTLAKRLWELDGSTVPVSRTVERLIQYYGDYFLVNAHACDMDYVDFYDMIVRHAKRLREENPGDTHPHIQIILELNDKMNDQPCDDFLTQYLIQ